MLMVLFRLPLPVRCYRLARRLVTCSWFRRVSLINYAGILSTAPGAPETTQTVSRIYSPQMFMTMVCLCHESFSHGDTEEKLFSLLRVSVPPWQFSFTAKSTKEKKISSLCSLCPSWFHLKAIDNGGVSLMSTLRMATILSSFPNHNSLSHKLSINDLICASLKSFPCFQGGVLYLGPA